MAHELRSAPRDKSAFALAVCFGLEDGGGSPITRTTGSNPNPDHQSKPPTKNYLASICLSPLEGMKVCPVVMDSLQNQTWEISSILKQMDVEEMYKTQGNPPGHKENTNFNSSAPRQATDFFLEPNFLAFRRRCSPSSRS